MDKKIIRNNYLEIIEIHKLLIEENKHKISKYFEDFYYDTTNKLNCKLNEYEKSGLLDIKYYILLDSVGKFINKYDIDISTIKKSTIDKVIDHCRLNVLNKACFSEPEDEINDDNEDEISDDGNNNNENINSNIMDDLHIVLKKAIISNSEELMNNTTKLMNTLLTTNTVTNKENNINKVTTYFKTPEWIKVNTCTINAKNNKNLGNESFKYVIAASKTSGKNRSRLTNIEKFINDFVFKGINYTLQKKIMKPLKTIIHRSN